MQDNKFLSVVDASRVSGFAPQYLYLMLRVGRIAGAFKLGGNWQIDRKAFEKQFASRIAAHKASEKVRRPVASGEAVVVA